MRDAVAPSSLLDKNENVVLFCWLGVVKVAEWMADENVNPIKPKNMLWLMKLVKNDLRLYLLFVSFLKVFPLFHHPTVIGEFVWNRGTNEIFSNINSSSECDNMKIDYPLVPEI